VSRIKVEFAWPESALRCCCLQTIADTLRSVLTDRPVADRQTGCCSGVEYGPRALAASRLWRLPDCPLLAENVGARGPLDGGKEKGNLREGACETRKQASWSP